MELINILTIALFFIFGLSFGFVLNKKITKYTIDLERNKELQRVERAFGDILINISKGKSKFKNRYMNNVFIKTFLYGKEVDVIYLIDKKDIYILENEVVTYKSNLINKYITNSIISNINRNHIDDINDIIDIFGFVLNRKYFENLTGNKIENLRIINIQKEKETKVFNIDDILDKISEVGMESLTLSEKKFLDNYSDDDKTKN